MTLLAEGRLSFVAGAPSRALRALPATAFLIDLSIVTVAFALAMIGRDRLMVFQPSTPAPSNWEMVGPVMVAGWLAAVWLTGGYRKDVFGAGTDEYKRLIHASLLAAGLVGVACYLAKFPLSRGFFLLAFVVGVPSLMLGRLTLRRALYRVRSRGALMQRVVIAGTPSHVDEVAGVLRRETWLGYQVVGALIPDSHHLSETTCGVPVLGTPDQVLGSVENADADVIFLAGGALDSAGQMRRIAWELEDRDVQVVIAPSVTDIAAERIRVRPVGGLPLMHVDKPRTVHASRAGKRLFDIAGSLALLLAFAPVFAVAAVWVRLHDGGPVLFAQVRNGRDGRTFPCLKFRSMVPDAELLLAELKVSSGHDGGLFKMTEDPRITRPGRWLRRYSLDELPQLLNVLRGEMSLVGPRPPLPCEVAAYERDTERRLRVRPGMTGLWQVSGRSDLSFEEAIRLDLYYVDNWSMVQDLAILFRTLGAVVRSRGAY